MDHSAPNQLNSQHDGLALVHLYDIGAGDQPLELEHTPRDTAQGRSHLSAMACAFLPGSGIVSGDGLSQVIQRAHAQPISQEVP